MGDLFIERGAEFEGEQQEYRSMLWRRWDKSKPRLVFIMLNPSTADGETDDATIRICMGRARRMGAGGIRVANLFMLRATHPIELRRHPDPVGPGADINLANALQGCPMMVIAAWGDDGRLKGHHRERWREACEILCYDYGVTLHALRLTKAGQPCHPLRIPYSASPFPWMTRESWPNPIAR